MKEENSRSSQPSRILLVIVVAQFCGTSLWFAGNAALPQLESLYNWPVDALSWLTSLVQLGFISGTLLFAIIGLADKVSPSRLFFVCSLLGGLANAIALLQPESFALALASRCLTGFFLAGIYPVGMKIAADWQEHGLGHWLGALVGALVLGTAFPHALKLIPQFTQAQFLMAGVSVLAVVGGILMLLLVPDGPFRKTGSSFSFSAVRKAFNIGEFKSAAFGYFGHMWELYAFWAFVPYIIRQYTTPDCMTAKTLFLSEPLTAFLVLASGAVGCVAGGRLSLKIGSSKVAFIALLVSGACCLFSPWLWDMPQMAFILFMCLWGFAVVADSPQFSAVVARSAPAEVRGSAITVVTSIGFAITIVSIQLLSFVGSHLGTNRFLLLLPGPVVGLFLMKKMISKKPVS